MKMTMEVIGHQEHTVEGYDQAGKRRYNVAVDDGAILEKSVKCYVSSTYVCTSISVENI